MITKFIGGLIIFFVAASAMPGCNYFDDPSDPRVRFMNSSDFHMYWGVRLGSAEYDGRLFNGDSTGYIPSRHGTFMPQFKQEDGTWIDAGYSAFTLKEGHKYTLSQTGSIWNLMLVLTDD